MTEKRSAWELSMGAMDVIDEPEERRTRIRMEEDIALLRSRMDPAHIRHVCLTRHG